MVAVLPDALFRLWRSDVNIILYIDRLIDRYVYNIIYIYIFVSNICA